MKKIELSRKFTFLFIGFLGLILAFNLAMLMGNILEKITYSMSSIYLLICLSVIIFSVLVFLFFYINILTYEAALKRQKDNFKKLNESKKKYEYIYSLNKEDFVQYVKENFSLIHEKEQDFKLSLKEGIDLIFDENEIKEKTWKKIQEKRNNIFNQKTLKKPWQYSFLARMLRHKEY
ncbi:hypothetical protein C0583_05195 [Candidatus Parcubacteria bacterium]|nr:MAG: hypothetical protein C0583_05195 [Candidatus Parcubacteria bacterium]